MNKPGFLRSQKQSHHSARRSIRLAYRGRTGARWTYSPTVTQSRPDWLEVSMLMPLAVGRPVDIEPLSQDSSDESDVVPQRVRARVTACQCSADGLFRIRLALPST